MACSFLWITLLKKHPNLFSQRKSWCKFPVRASGRCGGQSRQTPNLPPTLRSLALMLVQGCGVGATSLKGQSPALVRCNLRATLRLAFFHKKQAGSELFLSARCWARFAYKKRHRKGRKRSMPPIVFDVITRLARRTLKDSTLMQKRRKWVLLNYKLGC